MPRSAHSRHKTSLSSAVVETAPEAVLAPEVPVLYIHPAKQGMDFFATEALGRPYGLIPVGVAALVNRWLDHGIGVWGVNFPLEKQLDHGFRLEAWLRKNRGARAVLIDMHWYEHCYGAIQTALFVKRILPGIQVILGGLSAAGFAKEIFEAFPHAVDYIIRGDAEDPLLKLMQTILANPERPQDDALSAIPNLTYLVRGQVVETPLTYVATSAMLDTLNFVDIDFLEHHREYFAHEYIVTDISRAREILDTEARYTGKWTTTARGCKFECSYCGGGRSAHKKLAGRQGLIVRSPEKVAADIACLHANGVIQTSMTWDIAEIDEAYWRDLFAEMDRLGLPRTGLYNEFFQMPDLAFVDALAAHADMDHSAVAVSPLSGNERVRRLNGKHFGTDALFELLERLARHKFYLLVYFSLNLPGETKETFPQTLDLAKEIYDFYPKSRLKILNTVHTIDPLSPMNVKADRFGVRSSFSTFLDYYNYCRDSGKNDQTGRGGHLHGYEVDGRSTEDQLAMAAAWDAARQGREGSWWPVPGGW